MENNSPETDLRTALGKLGAREFEYVALTMDPHRGLAAIAYAQQRGVDHPIPYAIKLFDNAEWQPAAAKKPVTTNLSVERQCATCDGHRFVEVTNDPLVPYGETYKPCPTCNSTVDAGFWKASGERFVVAK